MNKERYKDPTADIAIANVMREEKRRAKQEGGNVGKKQRKNTNCMTRVFDTSG